jgi:hypothetical protein
MSGIHYLELLSFFRKAFNKEASMSATFLSASASWEKEVLFSGKYQHLLVWLHFIDGSFFITILSEGE